MRLRGLSAALVVMIACLAFLAVYSLQLHRDYNILSHRYAELQRDYEALSLDYSKLRDDYEVLSSRFSDLSVEYERLSNEHFSLREDYSRLKDQYSSLERSYSSLLSRYADLESRCNLLVDACSKLNETVAYVIRVVNSFGLLRDAMPRVLNSDAVRATISAVLSVDVSKSDFWGSMQRIYNYVVSNVEYVHDVEMPVWYVSSTIRLNGQTYVHEVRYYNVWNYVQNPELTLRIGQGDCEDQAILVYAMAKCYMREVCGVDYALYLMYVEFHSGSAHMAVLLPVQGGRVCIMDPAGRYLTSQYGRIASRAALEELQRYSSHWVHEGGVKYVELWDVKLDGSAFVVARGTIEEVARALS